MSPVVWLFALAITTFAATIQGTVGIGYALVAVPLMALLDPVLAPVPQLLTALPLTIAMAVRERRHLDLSGVGWLVAGRLPGAAIGVGLLAIITQRALDLLIGVLVLAAVAAIGSGAQVRRNRATQLGAGVVSGATSMVTSIGGPPTALLYTSAEAATLRSTLAAVFTIGISVTAVVRFATGNVSQTDLRVSLVLLPAVLFGWWISLRYKDRFSKQGVRAGVLAVSGLAALGLIIRAIAG